MTLAAQQRHPYESIASTTRVRRREHGAACRIAALADRSGAQVTSPTNPAARGARDAANARRFHDSRGPVTTG